MSELTPHIGYMVNRLGQEIKHELVSDGSTLNRNNIPQYQTSKGRRITLNELSKQGLDQEIVVGAIRISYISTSKEKYMIIDRIIRSKGKFKKKRRLYYDLTSKSGQIGSTLLLELLKLENGQRFSKHKFIQHVEQEYFTATNSLINRSELNEVLSRMLRKTLVEFFGINGRNFRREEFFLHIEEVEAQHPNQSVARYKSKLNTKTEKFLQTINGIVG